MTEPNSQEPPWDTPEPAEPLPMIQGVEMIWQPASPATEREGDQQAADVEPTQVHTDASQQNMGNVPALQQPEPVAGDAELPAREDVQALVNRVRARLHSEGRWYGRIELERDQMMKDGKKRIPDKSARQAWVYSELDRMYPPIVNAEHIVNKKGSNSPGNNESTCTGNQTIVGFSGSDEGSIQGLGTIPEGWPSLPANASLSAEIGWVQANRLRVVKEQPGKATIVDLGKALSPAPSWAALGWLETSIRSYAKFVDVAARATSSDDGEQGVMRRERMSIDEVRGLLAEMEDGRPGE